MRVLALTAAVVVALAAPAAAQQNSRQIELWPLAKISALGVEIFEQDVAASVATDAIFARFEGRPPPGVVGWVVVSHPEGRLVRFVSSANGELASGWDVIVRNHVAGEVTDATASPLTAQERAMFLARQTAIATPDLLRCAQSFNTVVVDDPDSDGWLVWLLAATTDAGIVPLGGHHRFRVSADGSAVLAHDQLSAACFNAERPARSQGGTSLFITSVVSDHPTEAHIFLSILNRLPIYVGVGDIMYAVEGAAISQIDAGE